MVDNEIVVSNKKDHGHPIYLIGSMLILLENSEEDEGEYTVYAQTEDGRSK